VKAHYRTSNGRVTVEVDGGNVKEIVKNIAIIQEVFESEAECGCCKSTRIRFQVREVDGNEYYELLCSDCGARFEFGQHKKTPTLFPKRKEGDKMLPNRGWAKWEGKKEKVA
jgi:hypothetical protein